MNGSRTFVNQMCMEKPTKGVVSFAAGEPEGVHVNEPIAGQRIEPKNCKLFAPK